MTQIPERKSAVTRWAAGAVLLLSTPLLMGSLGALLFFYLSPDRFSALLARLPGDQYIRSSLAFAPASLFAVVILATLYILERPDEKIAPAELGPTQPGAAFLAQDRREQVTKWFFRVSLAVFLGSVFTALLSFVNPARFWDLVGFLPGQRYLRVMVQFSPVFAFLLLSGVGLFRMRKKADGTVAGPDLSLSRLAVGLVLTVAVPFFLTSMAALGLFYLSPARFETLLQRISEGSFLRLTLISAPALLFSVVLLASLYLLNRPPDSAPLPTPSIELGAGRSRVAAGVLILGLLLSAALVLGLMGVILVLLLR